MVKNNDFKEQDHPRDDDGKFTEGSNLAKSFNEKSKNIKPIKINKNDIPQFESKKELSNWVKGQFSQLGSVEIDDTGIELKLSSGNANRETIKRRASKEENKAVFAKFKDIVSKAIKKDDRQADERHTKDQEIYYNKFQIDGEDYEVEIFVDKPDNRDKGSYYAGHNASKIRIAPRDTMDAQNELIHNAKSANYIMPYLEIDLNPTAQNSLQNSYNEILKYIQNWKGKTMTLEENLFKGLFSVLKAKNEAEDEKDNKAQNEDVDKRKLIDEVGGILKGKVDEELWRTIIGKIEKVAYDKSEAGTADNEDDENNKEKAKNKKAANEEVDKRELIRQIMAIAGKHEDNEDVRTIAKLAEKLAYDKSEAGTADNKAKNKCKNEDGEDNNKEKEYKELKQKVYEEVKNEIAKNAMESLKSDFYTGK